MQPARPILIVEDDAELRQSIEWALTDEGLAVALARNGQQARAHIAEFQPAAVVLDWRLPDTQGVSVAAALRERYGDSVPIILITADGHAVDKARQIGARSYLHKPFDVARLVDAVQQALGG